jgi:hypothetical protein
VVHPPGLISIEPNAMQARLSRSDRIDLVDIADVNGISHCDRGDATRAMEDLGGRFRLTTFR